MLREIVHFLRYVPWVVRTSRGKRKAEFFDLLMDEADAAGALVWRKRLVEGLAGEVLEIGCGTGRAFAHYAPGVRVTATEPDEKFIRYAEPAVQRAAADIELQVAEAECLPFADASFDTVVVSAVLCSVNSVEDVLAEIKRVLRPGGEVRLVEHIRSPRLVPGLLMQWFNPLWLAWNRQGCNMNRRTDAVLAAAGFDIVASEPFQIFARGLPAFPSLWMRAVVR